MAGTETAGDVLRGEPPAFTPEAAAELAARWFGLVGDATPLGSERDQGFMIRAADGPDRRAEDLERERVAGGRRHGDRRRAARAGRRSDDPRVGAAARGGRRSGRRPRLVRDDRGRSRGRRASRPGVHLSAGDRVDRPAPARRRRPVRLRGHGGAARPGHAVVLPPVGGPGAAVGRPARVVAAPDGRRDRRPCAPRAGRRGARPFRGRRASGVAVVAVAGDPRRRDAGQRARRRARAHQRDHRLGRHEPFGARL